MSKQAWVTLATNDSYALGALVLAHSLKRVSSAKPAVVLITPSVTESMRGRLGAVFAEVVTVDVLDSRDAAHLALLARPELGITFTKLHCWNLTQYDKCVFLDADTLVVQNCDELFEREELSAAPDVGWPDCFNSGVFVYSPSAETFEKLLSFAKERGSFDGGDQGLLNSYFSTWAHGDISKHLPFLYNVTSVAFYSYLPALKQYGQDVKIVHFIGNNKPWLANFNWESRTVDAPTHLQPTLQLWWDIFTSGVHSQLDTTMAGLAGTMARLTLGAPASQQPALDEHTRRQGWEAGNIDFMGADSFANIWAKISATLAQAPSPPAPEPALASAPQDIKSEEPDSPAPAPESEAAPAPAQVETSPEPQSAAVEVALPSEPVAEAFTAPASVPDEPEAPPVEAPVEAVKVAEPEATPVRAGPTEPIVASTTAPEVPKSEEPGTPPTKPVEAPVTEAPAEAIAAEVTPSKEAPQSSTDSPPLVSTPVKDAVSPKSAEEGESDTAIEEQAPRMESRKAPPTDKLNCQLKPSAELTQLLTPDSELEDAATLAQSIIASEIGIPPTPQVTSATPPILPAAPTLTDTKQLSVEEPELPTPPVSLAQIGILPSKPDVPAEISQSAQSPVAEISEDDLNFSDVKITKELETTSAPVATAELITPESKVCPSALTDEPNIPTIETSTLEDVSKLETKIALDLRGVEPAVPPQAEATTTTPTPDVKVAKPIPEPTVDASTAEVAVSKESLSPPQAESTSATEVIASTPTPQGEKPAPTPEAKLDEVIPEPKVDAPAAEVAVLPPEPKESLSPPQAESTSATEVIAAPPPPQREIPAPTPEAKLDEVIPEPKVDESEPKVAEPAQEQKDSLKTPKTVSTPATDVKAAPPTPEAIVPTPEAKIAATPPVTKVIASTPEANVAVSAQESKVSPKPTPATEVKAAPTTAEAKTPKSEAKVAPKPEAKVAPKPETKANITTKEPKTSQATPTPKKEAAVKPSEQTTTESTVKIESAPTPAKPAQPTASDTLSKTEEASSESKPDVAVEPRKKKVVKKMVKKESTESSEKGSGSSEPASPATPVPPPRKKEKKPAEKK